MTARQYVCAFALALLLATAPVTGLAQVTDIPPVNCDAGPDALFGELERRGLHKEITLLSERGWVLTIMVNPANGNWMVVRGFANGCAHVGDTGKEFFSHDKGVDI